MKGRWRELLSTLADLATVVSVAVMLLAGGGYALGRLSRTWLTVVLVAVLAALGVLAYLRRRAWWRAIRARYVSCVAWLAGPVKRDVVERLWAQRGEPVPVDIARTVPMLRRGALRVLLFALAAFGDSGPEPCWLSGRQVFPAPPDGFDPFVLDPYRSRVDELNDACYELVTARMLSRYKLNESEAGAHVWLRGEVGEANKTGEVSRLVWEILERQEG